MLADWQLSSVPHILVHSKTCLLVWHVGMHVGHASKYSTAVYTGTKFIICVNMQGTSSYSSTTLSYQSSAGSYSLKYLNNANISSLSLLRQYGTEPPIPGRYVLFVYGGEHVYTAVLVAGIRSVYCVYMCSAVCTFALYQYSSVYPGTIAQYSCVYQVLLYRGAGSVLCDRGSGPLFLNLVVY
jgi:hypothetical protein